MTDATIDATTDAAIERPWHQTACILCECNCGIEVRLGADGRTFERIRGDKAHPASQGYTCEKALRLDHYQNGRGERVLHPLRRRAGRHVRGDRLGHRGPRGRGAARRGARRARRRQDPVLRRRRAGQPPRAAPTARRCTRGSAASTARSAIAQEKSGEVLGQRHACSATPCAASSTSARSPSSSARTRGMSHGIPHARTTLKAIANDPAPVDGRDRPPASPRPPSWPTSTSRCAPGRDAWLLAAMVADHRPGGPARRRLAAPSTPTGSTTSTPASATIDDRRVLRDRRRRRGPRAARPRGASPRRRASPCSRTSACR